MKSPSIWASVTGSSSTGYRFAVHARNEKHGATLRSRVYAHRTDALRALEAVTRTRARPLELEHTRRTLRTTYVLDGCNAEGEYEAYPLHILTPRPWKGWPPVALVWQ